MPDGAYYRHEHYQVSVKWRSKHAVNDAQEHFRRICISYYMCRLISIYTLALQIRQRPQQTDLRKYGKNRHFQSLTIQ